MTVQRRALSNKVIQPDYAGLVGVVFHHRTEGLVVNSTNAAGVTDGSGNVTKIISMDPHVTGNEFDSLGTAPVLSAGELVYGGAGNMRHNGASSVFNNFHFRGAIADLKWAVHGVIKVGASANPNANIALFGNNGGSTSNKGICAFYADVSGSNNNALLIQVTRGTSNSFISSAANQNMLTPDRYLDFWIQCDKSQPIEDQIQVYINGFRFVVSNRVDSSTMVTTPTFAMEIGAFGNALFRGVVAYKEITFQDAINTDVFRGNFITDRMYKYGILPFPTIVDGITLTTDWILTDVFDEDRYYLTTHLCQKPSDPNVIVSIFSDTVSHLYESARKISMRKSVDKGNTWSAKSLVFDISGAFAPIDPGAGYGDDDRLHVITDAMDSGLISANSALWYLYSDDDGATWSTPVDITSILPADGLAAWRVYCNIIENDGVLMTVMYKFTGNGSSTDSKRLCLRSTDNGANWTAVTIQTQTSTQFRGESAIVALSATFLLVVSRDENTGEWYQSVSTDNGVTWSNQGALTLGEAITPLAGPVRLKKFQIAGTDVVVCYYIDRNQDLFKAVYALASSIISSGISGWNLGTKFTIHQGSGEHLHYGDVCHRDNDFNAMAMYIIDQYPPTGAGTENELYTIIVPTFHYGFVKTALGL